MSDMSEVAVYQRMLQRERKARADAEKYLEQKSLELYEANQNLQQAMALYRRDAFYLKTVLDSATDGILTINGAGKVDTANPSACRIFRYGHDEIVGRCAGELVTMDAKTCRPTPENHFFADSGDDNQPTMEAVGRRADGDRIALELSASHGEVDGEVVVTWVLRDITFIRAMQRQAAVSQRLAGIGELAAGIAHEINTPVQFVHENIKFLTEAFEAIDRVLRVYETDTELTDSLCAALEKACPSDRLEFYRSEASGAFQETKAGAQRIARIVSAVKDFSHPGTEQKTPIDLNAVVHSAATVSYNQWKDIAKLKLELADDLPLIDAYPSQINQVLVNLLVNAADAIAELPHNEDRGTGSIIITTGAHGGRVFVAVADSGAGIDPADLERVFLPFFTTKPVGKGTGQGLTITHSIVVENHGGAIDIDSEPGAGTTFTIYLPVTSPVSAQQTPAYQ